MKKILFLLSILTLSFTSCSNEEKAENVAAEETAEQMEDPVIAGRNAAKVFINREWKDTLELQNMLLEAKSKQSKYIINGEPEKAAQFDSAFISTIKTVRPSLAREIFD
jgi:hypothetical protein